MFAGDNVGIFIQKFVVNSEVRKYKYFQNSYIAALKCHYHPRSLILAKIESYITC